MGLPELRRVIVAYEDDVVMEENLELALQRLFYKGKGIPVSADKSTAQVQRSPETLVKDAMRVYEKALQMQRQGDWSGYGEQIRELGKILNKMAK